MSGEEFTIQDLVDFLEQMKMIRLPEKLRSAEPAEVTKTINQLIEAMQSQATLDLVPGLPDDEGPAEEGASTIASARPAALETPPFSQPNEVDPLLWCVPKSIVHWAGPGVIAQFHAIRARDKQDWVGYGEEFDVYIPHLSPPPEIGLSKLHIPNPSSYMIDDAGDAILVGSPPSFVEDIDSVLPIFWGIATEKVTHAAGNGSYVMVYPCDDMIGSNPNEAVAYKIWLPRTGEAPLNVAVGDVIGYYYDLNSERICVTEYSDLGHVRWAKAYEQWTKIADNGSYVMAHPCNDKDGTAEDVEVDIMIFLPRTAGRDPNVNNDEMIGYRTAWNPTTTAFENFSALDTCDGKIGEAKLWVLGSDAGGTVDTSLVPKGWRVLDAVDHDSRGASDWDMKGAFLVAWHSATGKTLNAADSATYYKTIGESGGYDLHGMSNSGENNHPDHLDHYHSIAAMVTTTGLQTGATTITHINCNCGPGYLTGWPLNVCGTAKHVLRHGGVLHAWIALDPVDEAHTNRDTDNRPEYFTVVVIERYDNSKV